MNTEQLKTILETIKSTFGDELWTSALAQMQEAEDDALLCPGSQKSAGHVAESPYPAMFPSFTAAKAEAEAEAESKGKKAKKVLSPEHLAALKAGREAAKAKRAAEAQPAEPVTKAEKAKKVLSPEHLAALKAGREAAKAKKAAEAESAKSSGASSEAEEIASAPAAVVRKPWSEETKAAAKAKRDAKKAEKVVAAALPPLEQPEQQEEMGAGWQELLAGM